MAFIRNCVTTAVLLLCISLNVKAQTVYYPALSSQLLKATAEDMALLLQKATPGTVYNTQPYTAMPAAGIILQYNSTITDNQACKVESDGATFIKFTAAEDNGLHFGMYQYLQQLGFRFYQPGTIWEIIPALPAAYKKIDTVFTCSFKYKTWFLSGGHSRWVMDNSTAISWDAYAGENGHNWAKYQRRNGMLGSSTFKGHRGDVMSGDYLTTLQNNPCYVANFNGSRAANNQSVPDIFNTAATDLWASTIEQKFTQNRNTILNSGYFYMNELRNFNYGNKHISIEVPDGARWGNAKENDVCAAVDYPKESDQHFMLANKTAEKILQKYPELRFQLYAYSAHADVPSETVAINKNIDVQLVPTVYQLESSTNGLRNRWYKRSANVSEYLYLNLSGWSGETPAFNWAELKQTLQIAKDKKSQGVVWEAAPSKFASLPYLLAANANLKDGTPVDITLQEFCNNMFDDAAATIYKMMQLWGSEQAAPDKYKMQIYLDLMRTAVQQTQQAPQVVKERMMELKAFIHYMALFYDLDNNDQLKTAKADKDAAICMYLAKTNKMQLVNSYFVITTIAARYGATSDFYAKYNATNGTAYLNGSLPLITDAEIENNFTEDMSKFSTTLLFALHTEEEIKDQFNAGKMAPLEKIVTQIGYTNGANYYNKTSFGIMAPAAGKFTINYTPRFDMAGKGYINFVVENAGKALEIITDVSIDNTNKGGTITVTLPAAGKYLLSVVSKYKSAVELTINTNGNYFYKKGAFLGNKTESYAKADSCLPGYFYVPQGLAKIYFTVTNGFSGGKFALATAINNSFLFKDNMGNAVQAQLATPADSSLFYIEVPATATGTFWQATAMSQYNLKFVNTSNLLWYAQRKSFGNVKQEEKPAAGSNMPVPVMYPNPSTGIFNCMQNGAAVNAENITVFTTQGAKMGNFKNARQFNITNAPAGVYAYQATVNGKIYNGKIVKL